MRHAHRFRRDGSNFLGIHRHGSPPSSASPDALALVLLSVLPILSCFSRLYFCFHSPAESYMGTVAVLRLPPPIPRDRLLYAGRIYVNGWRNSVKLRSSYSTETLLRLCG